MKFPPLTLISHIRVMINRTKAFLLEKVEILNNQSYKALNYMSHKSIQC
jgi:hypothetical protein